MTESHLLPARVRTTGGAGDPLTRRNADAWPFFVSNANSAVSALLALAEGHDDPLSLSYPADAYNLLGGLELLANRERRLLLHLSRALIELERTNRIVMDEDASQPNPESAVGDAVSAITRASVLLNALEAALDAARQPLACAALRPPESPMLGASR